MRRKVSSRQKKPNWAGRFHLFPSKAKFKARQPPDVSARISFFPQSVLPTREDGEVFVIGQGKRTEISFTG